MIKRKQYPDQLWKKLERLLDNHFRECEYPHLQLESSLRRELYNLLFADLELPVKYYMEQNSHE